MTITSTKAAEQGQIVTLLRTLGATVYDVGTAPDLVAFLPMPPSMYTRHPDLGPNHRTVYFIEVTAKGEQPSPAQVGFVECCRMAKVNYLVGGVDDVIAHFVRFGYLQADQVPPYRQPATEETTP